MSFDINNISKTLWLDASDEDTITLDIDDKVEEWKDKSGNDNHVIQQVNSNFRPSYNDVGRKCVVFNNSNTHYLYNTTTKFNLPSRSMFIVAEETVSTATAGIFCIEGIYNDWDSNDGLACGTGNKSSTNMGVAVSSRHTSWIPNGNGAGYAHSISGTGLTPLGIYNENFLAPNGTLYINGFLKSSQTATHSFANESFGGFTIGCRIGLGSPKGTFPDKYSIFLTGRIYEIIYCDTILPENERLLVEGYLSNKWNISLIHNHPYGSKIKVLDYHHSDICFTRIDKPKIIETITTTNPMNFFCLEYPLMIRRGNQIITPTHNNQLVFGLKDNNHRPDRKHFIVGYEVDNPNRVVTLFNREYTKHGNRNTPVYGSLNEEPTKVIIQDTNNYKLRRPNINFYAPYIQPYYWRNLISIIFEYIQVNNPSQLIVLRQLDGQHYYRKFIIQSGYYRFDNVVSNFPVIMILYDTVTNDIRVIGNRMPSLSGRREPSYTTAHHLAFTDTPETYLLKKINGNFIKAIGGPGDVVYVRQWLEEKKGFIAIPENNGDWVAYVEPGDYDISYFSDCAPIIHGPYEIE